jgi:hypothetical protein
MIRNLTSQERYYNIQKCNLLENYIQDKTGWDVVNFKSLTHSYFAQIYVDTHPTSLDEFNIELESKFNARIKMTFDDLKTRRYDVYMDKEYFNTTYEDVGIIIQKFALFLFFILTLLLMNDFGFITLPIDIIIKFIKLQLKIKLKIK